MIKKISTLVFFVFFILTLIYLFDVSYLFHGIRSTYLRGESSAQIDDSDFFYTRGVPALSPFELPLGENYKTVIEDDSLAHVLKKHKTTSFLIIQNDSVRLEKYWGLGSDSSLTNSFSMAKSIVSLLVGCAIDGGYIDGVDQSVFDFLPELNSFKEYDVKIKHLLEMSSGYDWLEDYKRPISVTAKAYYGNNLKNLVLNRDFVSVPGLNYNYISGNTQLLGVLLERAVGENISSYASRVLWSKVGAKNDAFWTLDYSGGVEKAFCCFNSNARDFSKIGLLMLNGGVAVDGERVLSKKYVDWLLSVPPLVDADSGKKIIHYSNGWWVAKVLGKDVFYARGFLGQYLVVIPELNLVFVRLGMKEKDKSELNNDYMLTDNLKFFIEYVIFEYSN